MQLGGSNVYLNFTISGLLEIPAYTAALLLLLRCGRRAPYCGAMLACGLSLLSILLVPASLPGLATAVALSGKVGPSIIIRLYQIIFELSFILTLLSPSVSQSNYLCEYVRNRYSC